MHPHDPPANNTLENREADRASPRTDDVTVTLSIVCARADVKRVQRVITSGLYDGIFDDPDPVRSYQWIISDPATTAAMWQRGVVENTGDIHDGR